MKIIDGKKIAKKIKDKIVKEIVELNHGSLLAEKRPNLAIILVGEREDSRLYVEMKEAEGKKVGIDTHLYRCHGEDSEEDIISIIECLNNDDMIDGILVQLPLPKKFDTNKIIKAMDPEKDVDRFHPDNLKKLLSSCDIDDVMPPVYSSVLEILHDIKFDIKDKSVCIVANSDIFGKSLGKVLECRGAKIKAVHTDKKNILAEACHADVLITAVGQPKLIKKEMIKRGAVVIDVGITKEGKKVSGDVDMDDVADLDGYITPVPGGVGPMTIAMLFRNTLELYKKRARRQEDK